MALSRVTAHACVAGTDRDDRDTFRPSTKWPVGPSGGGKNDWSGSPTTTTVPGGGTTAPGGAQPAGVVRLPNANSGADLGTVGTVDRGQIGSDIAGGTEMDFTFFDTMRDLKASLDMSNTFSLALGEGGASGPGADIVATLAGKLQNIDQKVFLLIRSRKAHPTRSDDVISTPVFNKELMSVVFPDGQRPTDARAMEEAYVRLFEVCGDQYVQAVGRGREVWLVAAMNRKEFHASYNPGVTVGIKVSGKEGERAAEAAGGDAMKAGLKAESSADVMSTKIEYVMRGRGINAMDVGEMTLKGALASVNKALVAKNEQDNEGVLTVVTADYDQVIFPFDGGAQMGGSMFTREVRERVSKGDVLHRLRLEHEQARRDAAYLERTYGWDQWSFESFKGGVALTYKGLLDYAQSVKQTLDYCGKLNIATVSGECLAMAEKVAKTQRPRLSLTSLPKPLPKINLSIRGDIANKTTMVSYEEALKGCQSIGETLPSLDVWKRVIEGSFNYGQWKKMIDPVYSPAQDQSVWGRVCGQFRGGYFWSDRKSVGIKIDDYCMSQRAMDTKLPNTYRQMSWVFWSTEKAPYVCVSSR
jgi:hypothetical protein